MPKNDLMAAEKFVDVSDDPFKKCDDNYTFDWEKWREFREKLNVIYEKQRLNGGLIESGITRRHRVISGENLIQ